MNLLKAANLGILTLLAAGNHVISQTMIITPTGLVYPPPLNAALGYLGLAGIALIIVFDKRIEKWRDN